MSITLDPRIMAAMPIKPYCGDELLKSGLVIRPRVLALKKKYIQFNPPDAISFLIYDIDRQGGAFAADDADLPQATFTVINPANRHAHLIYALENPVCTTENGHERPKKYVCAIEDAYTLRLGADSRYAGLVCKNPCNPFWETLPTGVLYDLSTLADSVELTTDKAEAIAANAPGRNCGIFDNLREWAYKAVREYWNGERFDEWFNSVTRTAETMNGKLPRPLDAREVVHIAKSVARWTWREFTPDGLEALISRTHTPELQRARRAKRTEKQDEKRVQGLKLIEQGISISRVARALGVGESTVKRWKADNKKGKNDNEYFRKVS
jgi:hypothetical protein